MSKLGMKRVTLTLFFPMSLFDPTETLENLELFDVSGGSKRNIGKKRANLFKHNVKKYLILKKTEKFGSKHHGANGP